MVWRAPWMWDAPGKLKEHGNECSPNFPTASMGPFTSVLDRSETDQSQNRSECERLNAN